MPASPSADDAAVRVHRNGGDRDDGHIDDSDHIADGDHIDVGGVPAVLADRALLAAVWTGFAAAALGFFVAVVVALAMWIPDAAATGTSGSTVRGGLLAFLAAQHGGLRLAGVDIGFVPLGLTWFAVYLCRRSGRVLWTVPSVAGVVQGRRVLELTAVQTAGYAVTTTLVSCYAVVGRSSASPTAAALGSTVVALVGFGSVALTSTPVGAAGWARLPASARAAVRAGAAASCTFIAGGAFLAMGSTLGHAGRFLELSRGMGRGLSGLPVAMGDTMAAPNAVLAAAAYLAGPGFAVGHHTTYAPFGGHGGLVPAFPVVSGLPVGEHAGLSVLALMGLIVLGAGLAAGSIVARQTAGLSWPRALGAAAAGGACAAVLLGALTALAGGPLGSRRLQTVGASATHVALAVLVEVTVVAGATVGVRRLFAHRAGRAHVVREDRAADADAKSDVAESADAGVTNAAGGDDVEVFDDAAIFDDAKRAGTATRAGTGTRAGAGAHDRADERAANAS